MTSFDVGFTLPTEIGLNGPVDRFVSYYRLLWCTVFYYNVFVLQNSVVYFVELKLRAFL